MRHVLRFRRKPGAKLPGIKYNGRIAAIIAENKTTDKLPTAGNSVIMLWLCIDIIRRAR